MQFNSDVDIDFGDRDQILKHIKHIPASMRDVKPQRKHPTGIYVTDIPYNPIDLMASLDYQEAGARGYLKLDLLNVHVYNQVRDETHLLELMREPNWEKLQDPLFVERLIHISNHHSTIIKMPEPINSIPRLAMFLALIRPGKKHLIGSSWAEISKTIWDKGDDGYVFKKSHSIAYSQLVVVHMNLLCEQEREINLLWQALD
jgi:hypothetical protein